MAFCPAPEFGVRGEEGIASRGGFRRLRGGPLDEVAELMHVLIEEDDDRDRLVEALIQVLIDQVFILIAQKDPEV